jgi:hypothetical protein
MSADEKGDAYEGLLEIRTSLRRKSQMIFGPRSCKSKMCLEISRDEWHPDQPKSF